jgi:hypothetical protein
LLHQTSILSCEQTKYGDCRELDTASGKRGYKLNIRYIISVAVKELFCRHK